MAVFRLGFLISALCLAAGGGLFAQSEVLFEDTFTGANGTVLPVGETEDYQVTSRTNVVLTPTIEENQLQLKVGPNLDGAASSLSVININTPFDFQGRPLLFEVDVALGNTTTTLFGVHNSLGNTAIERAPNSVSAIFYNNGERLLFTGRGGDGETFRYEETRFSKRNVRLGIYLDATDAKFFIDGVQVLSEPHGLSLEAIAEAYVGLQVHGGGGATHSAAFDNLKVTANPDFTPDPEVLLSDTFSGEDGEIPVGNPNSYHVTLRDGAVVGVSRESEQLKLTMGPNTTGANTFAMFHHGTRFRFDQQPVLFEVDIDPGDMSTVAVGLHDWLGNNSLMYGNNVNVNLYGDRTLVFATKNGGDATGARWESEAGAFLDRKFRLGIYLDAANAKFIVDGEVLYDGPHYLAQTLLDKGVYFGIQLYGGATDIQSARFDNIVVTAHPDMTIPEVVPGDVFWTTDTAIRSSRFDGSDVRTVVDGLARPIGLAVDFEQEQMYWIEHDSGFVMSADTMGEQSEMVNSGLNSGQFLALDAEAKTLYWSEWSDGVFSSPVEGWGRDYLFSAPSSQNAGIAFSNDRLYLVSAADGEVVRYDLGGNGTAESVTTFAGESYSIAVDAGETKVFATNFSGNWIQAFDLQQGGETETIWSEGLSGPLGLTVSSDGKKLYWVERVDGKVRVANASGLGAIVTLVEGESSPFGIAVRPVGEATGGFAGWIDGFGLTVDQMGELDDPAGDGIPNILKYALGLNPTESRRDALPTPVVAEIAGSRYLTLSVERNAEAVGLTWFFEVSSDLVTWSSGETDVVVTEETESVLTARSAASIEESGRIFIRARLVAE